MYLVKVLEYEAPLSPPRRYELEGVHDVVIGRAELPAHNERIRAGRLEARVDLADARVSSNHARLSRMGREWMLADLGSRNGTFVNGVAAQPILSTAPPLRAAPGWPRVGRSSFASLPPPLTGLTPPCCQPRRESSER